MPHPLRLLPPASIPAYAFLTRVAPGLHPTHTAIASVVAARLPTALRILWAAYWSSLITTTAATSLLYSGRSRNTARAARALSALSGAGYLGRAGRGVYYITETGAGVAHAILKGLTEWLSGTCRAEGAPPEVYTKATRAIRAHRLGRHAEENYVLIDGEECTRLLQGYLGPSAARAFLPLRWVGALSLRGTRYHVVGPDITYMATPYRATPPPPDPRAVEWVARMLFGGGRE